MRISLLCALVLGLAIAMPAHAEIPQGAITASHAFDDAQRRQNADDIGQYLAPDFRIIYSSGRVGDRDAFIAGFTSPTMRITELFVEEPLSVDLGDDAAVFGGIGVIRGTESGAPFEERFRFADTFARRDGRWVAVYVQVTPLAQPAQ